MNTKTTPEPASFDNPNWMNTSTGKRFYPSAPDANVICMSDIANGLAMDCRYSGQIDINKFYSVAEHSFILAKYALDLNWNAKGAFAILMHDAAEGYLNDLCRAVKGAVGESYKFLEADVQQVIADKDGIAEFYEGDMGEAIKTLDRRICVNEKKALFRHDIQWPASNLVALPGVTIRCMSPRYAKVEFLKMYEYLCDADSTIPRETWEI